MIRYGSKGTHRRNPNQTCHIFSRTYSLKLLPRGGHRLKSN
jgi:hypothetical protein